MKSSAKAACRVRRFPSTLLSLEMKRVVKQLPGKLFVRNGHRKCFCRAGDIGFDFGWRKKNEVASKLRIRPGRGRNGAGAVSDALLRLFAGHRFWHLVAGSFTKAGSEVAFQLNADVCSI
jgi:hypothetical protein